MELSRQVEVSFHCCRSFPAFSPATLQRWTRSLVCLNFTDSHLSPSLSVDFSPHCLEVAQNSQHFPFLLTFYFVLGYSQLTLWFQVSSKGTQPYTYMDPFSPNSPPIHAATWHGAEFPVLSSRSLLVLHVKYSSVSISILNSLTIPFPILPPGDHKVITEYWAEFPVLSSRSLLVLHVKYSSVSMSIPNSLTIPSLQQPYVCSLNLWVSFCFVS